MAKLGTKRFKPNAMERYTKERAAMAASLNLAGELCATVLGSDAHAADLLSSKPTEASLFASAHAVLHKARKTYKYKLYSSKRLRHLHHTIGAAGMAHNHIVALHRRYYRLCKKHISLTKMQHHMAKYRNRAMELVKERRAEAKCALVPPSKPRLAYLAELGAQTLQDCAARVENTYQRFFDYIRDKKAGLRPRKYGLPHFKKVRDYKSFTLKQSGWKLDQANSTLEINGRRYKYHNSRPILGEIKTATVKRDAVGDVFVFFSAVVEVPTVMVRTGKSVGLDFGLKTFLTASDGNDIESPLFFAKNRNALKRADRRLSRKLEGSNNRRKAKVGRAKIYRHIKDSRRDWFFKLAWELCGRYALICIEDISGEFMKSSNGRKASDEAFGEFVLILEHVARRCGTTVQKVGRTFASTQMCSVCGEKNKSLAGREGLKIRDWVCPKCGTHHDRDYNAAVNILHEGEKIFFSENNTQVYL